MASHGNGPEFRVHCSETVARALYELQQQASPAQKKIFPRSFREIMRRLKSDPRNAGEPLYRLPGLRMQVRTMAIPPLAVIFGVCEDRPIVFIGGGRLLAEP
jgi:hypothetical protein